MIEKPIALTLDDAQSITETARKAGVYVVVGHSHSFDAPILRARALVNSGAYGPVRMISALNYTDFLYRPRRPEELDTAQGGGALFNQAPHQVDIVRLLGGGRVKSVCAQAGRWDATRPTEGAYSALMTFETGAFASLTYSGYGHFDSDEFQGWIGEMGQAKPANPRRERRRFADTAEEAAFKVSRTYGGANWTQVLAGNDRTGAIDLVMDTTHPEVLYAAMWDHARSAWNFREAGAGSGIYKSVDGGDTWARLGGGLPSGDHVGRIGLALSASRPNVLYASIDNWEPLPADAQDDGDRPLTARRLRRMDEAAFLAQDPDEIEAFIRRNDFDVEID